MIDEDILQAAHEACRQNRNLLENDKKCGCFYCQRVYDPSKIKKWIQELDIEKVETALCPNCGVDSVLSENAGFPLTEEFLKEMKERWFG